MGPTYKETKIANTTAYQQVRIHPSSAHRGTTWDCSSLLLGWNPTMMNRTKSLTMPSLCRPLRNLQKRTARTSTALGRRLSRGEGHADGEQRCRALEAAVACTARTHASPSPRSEPNLVPALRAQLDVLQYEQQLVLGLWGHTGRNDLKQHVHKGQHNGQGQVIQTTPPPHTHTHIHLSF